MADRTTRVRLEAIVGPFQAAMAQAAASTKQVAGELGKLSHLSQQQASQFQTLGRAGVVMGAGIAAGMGFAIKAAVDYESAFAGVRKTTDATEAQFAEISEGIRAMSRRMPASAVEIAGVAEAAGQLGIKRESILTFTETMIQLAATTNLTADQAAVAMARIANIMQIPQAEVAKLGATLVELGNNGASTESEILEMATRIASAGKQVGLTSADVLAFANALSSVGIEADAGGTAISRVMIEIQNAVMDGGDSLAMFAETAGMSAEKFVTSFQADPAEAIVSFIEGLRRVGDAGGNVNAVLEELGLSDIRVANAMRAAAGAGDLFRTSLATGQKAFEENVALALEYGKRLETTGAQLEIVKNQIMDVAISFGGEMLPAVRAVAEILSAFVAGVSAVSDLLGPLGPILIGLIGTLSLLGGAFFLVWSRIIATQAAMATLTATAPALAASLRTVMLASGGIGLALTLAAGAYALFARNQDDAVESTNKMTAAFDAFARGQVDVAQREVLNTLATEDLLGQLESLGITAQAVTDIMTTHQQGSAKNVAAMKAWDAALADAVASGKLTEEEAGALSSAVFKLGNDFANLAGDAGDVKGAEVELADVTIETSAAFDAAGTSAEDFSEALDTLFNATFGVQSATDAFTSDLADFADQVMAAKEAGDQHATSLSEGTATGLANREMLRNLTTAALDVADAMKAAGKSPEEIGAAMGQYRGAVLDVLDDLGFSATQANEFVDILLKIDGIKVSPEVYVDTDQAKKDLDDLILRLSAIQTGGDALGAIAATILGNAPSGASPVTSPVVQGAVRGEGPAATSARESRLSTGRSAVEDYLRALHEAEEERKRTEQAVNDFLRAMYEHQMELEDVMFRVGDMETDKYLELLQKRLAGLEKYSAEWERVYNQIKQIMGDTLEMELKIIAAYDAGRLFGASYAELANQRLLMAAPTTGSGSSTYNTTNWNLQQTAIGQNVDSALATNNQKLRDLAALS